MLPKHHAKQLKLNQSLTVNRQMNDDVSIITSIIFCIAIEENGVRLRLNIVDTPGYGDQVNNENWYVYKYYKIGTVHDFLILIITVGNLSSNTSRINIRLIYVKS